MSRGASITLGIACLLCGIGFLFVPFMGVGASPVGVVAIAIFCFLISSACLIPSSRQVTLRLIALIVLGVCLVYVWTTRNAQWWPSQAGQPSLGRATMALIVFGLPAAYVVVRGAYPTWGRGAEAFGAGNQRHRTYKPIILSWRRIPNDAKILIDGFWIERREWESIAIEANERNVPIPIAPWRRVVAKYGAFVILSAVIGFAVWRKTSPSISAVAAVAAMMVWWIFWIWPRTQRRPIRWQVMAERGYPICVNCGYNLHGSSDSGCPECGWRRETAPSGTESRT
jgi:hypothetical protein